MEVWYISHTAKEDFVLPVLIICHTECMYEVLRDTCHQLTTGKAAEEIIIVCLDAVMFAKSVLWMDYQL